MNDWVVGFDCGGTSTRAVILARDGRVLGQGVAGPSNYLVVGADAACAAIQAAFAAAMERADCEDRPCAAAVVAMAGAGASVDPVLVGKLRAMLSTGNIVIDGDIMAALSGAFPHGQGLVVIAGTGSVAFGVAANGERVQVGGWGYVLGDEGSGYAIGLDGLRAVLRFYDGRESPTILAPALLDHVGISSPAALVRRVYVEHMTRDEIAALAPIVADHATAGDLVAEGIIKHAGKTLASLAVTGIARLAAIGEVAGIAPLGGLFNIPMVARTFHDQLSILCPEVAVIAPRFDATGGTAIMALREAGVAPDHAVLAQLARTLVR